MAEALFQTVVAEASKAIPEKLKKGKKLTVEEILLLYLDLLYTQIGGLCEEIREVKKRIDETNKRIDSIQLELSEKIDETNRKIDTIHLELSKED